jgi:gamma-glutamylcyclotransferase (GGCT)/AIG2-like uncharacterized protein YtfP
VSQRPPAGRVWLFVYGTLRQGHAPAEVAPLLREARYLGAAELVGTLQQVGPHLGLVLDAERGARVPGELLELPEARLPAIDAYEGFEPERPARSLYLRTRVTARRDNGEEIECWTYVRGRP